MDPIKALTELGLTEKEAQVYVALLGTGRATATQISNRTKLHRPSVYDILERLMAKGFVAHITQDDTKFYEACDPSCISNLLREKESVLREVLPQLTLMKQFSGAEGEIRIVEGMMAFKDIMLRWLEQNEPIHVYGLPIKAVQRIGLPFIEEFHNQRIAKKIWMYHIYNSDGRERGKYLNTLPYTEARFLPQQFDSPVATNIIGDLLVLTLWEGAVLTLYIKNKSIANSYKKYFSLLWNAAKKE